MSQVQPKGWREQQFQGVGGCHWAQGDGPEADGGVGHLSAQLQRQPSALSPAGLVLQAVVPREEWGLPEKTNPLLMRTDY